MALIQTLKRHSLLTYFALAFGLTWACWIPLALSDAFASEATASPSLLLLLWPVGNLIPSLVGITLTALCSGRSGLGEVFRRLMQVRVALAWYAVVLLLVPVLLLVAIGVTTLLGGVTIASAWSSLIATLVLSLLIAGLGEELGWRGFALPRLQAHHRAFPASLFLGALWGLWHLPLLMAVGLVPLTFLGVVNFLIFDLTITCAGYLGHPFTKSGSCACTRALSPHRLSLRRDALARRLENRQVYFERILMQIPSATEQRYETFSLLIEEKRGG